MTRKDAENRISELFEFIKENCNDRLQKIRNQSVHVNGINLQLSFIISIDAFINAINPNKGVNSNLTTIIIICKTESIFKYKKYVPFLKFSYESFFLFDYENETYFSFNNIDKVFVSCEFSSIEKSLTENTKSFSE